MPGGERVLDFALDEAHLSMRHDVCRSDKQCLTA